MLEGKLLDGKVALITGGGTGLGKAMALKFADAGASIVIASRSPEHLASGQKDIAERGVEVLAVPCDVRDPTQVDALTQTAIHTFGHVDILVNNAAGNFICPTEKLSINGWNSVINSVLNGTFYCTRAIGLKMIERGAGGNILNIVATYAWTGNAGTIHSACAKAGVMAMTQTLGVEWAKYHIRVNAIAPGPIHTEGASSRLWGSPEAYEMIRRSVPLKRFGQPEDIANAALYLVSDLGNYITGECLVVDGGAWLNRNMFELEASS